MVVQSTKSMNLMPDSETKPPKTADKPPVKVEIEDSLEEEHGPLPKRSKRSQAFQEVLNEFCFVWFQITRGKQWENLWNFMYLTIVYLSKTGNYIQMSMISMFFIVR